MQRSKLSTGISKIWKDRRKRLILIGAILLFLILLALTIYFILRQRYKTVKKLASTLTYSPDWISHVKQSEGVFQNSYLDPVGIWTVGVGHNLQADPSYAGQDLSNISLSPDQVDALLKSDADKVKAWLDTHIGNLMLTQSQYDGIFDFAWGGVGTFQESTLYKYLTGILTPPNGDQSIADEFNKWVYGTVNGEKVVLPGLVIRRKWEADHYLNNT